MRILIDIGHPAHVHLFKNIAWQLIEKGHEVMWSVREIPVAKHLLNYYGFNYYNLGKKKDGITGKGFTIISQDFKMWRFVIKNDINFGLSSGIILPHVSKFSKMKAFVFDDDDDSVEKLVTKFAHPFADVVFSPNGIERAAQHRVMYPSTHEWTYLHPKYFRPDPSVLSKAGIKQGERFFIMRFVALKGHHDVGETGISNEQKQVLVNMLRQYGRVIITSERKIETEFEQYRLPVPPQDIHSLMYYSSLFLGDSQTMTTEAALLGVPALKCNSFAGRLAVPNMLENRYDLCYSFKPGDFDKFLAKAEELVDTPAIKEHWATKVQAFANDHIDATAFFIWFIENYPRSKRIIKDNPEYIYNFK